MLQIPIYHTSSLSPGSLLLLLLFVLHLLCCLRRIRYVLQKQPGEAGGWAAELALAVRSNGQLGAGWMLAGSVTRFSSVRRMLRGLLGCAALRCPDPAPTHVQRTHTHTPSVRLIRRRVRGCACASAVCLFARRLSCRTSLWGMQQPGQRSIPPQEWSATSTDKYFTQLLHPVCCLWCQNRIVLFFYVLVYFSVYSCKQVFIGVLVIISVYPWICLCTSDYIRVLIFVWLHVCIYVCVETCLCRCLEKISLMVTNLKPSLKMCIKHKMRITLENVHKHCLFCF